QVECAAGEIADQGQRDAGRLLPPSDGVQHAGDGNVVDIVAGYGGQLPVLAPAGDSAIYQPPVACQAILRTQAQAFGAARAEALDQCVGALDKIEHLAARGRILQIQGYRDAVAQQQVVAQFALDPQIDRFGALDAQHAGAQV